MPNKVCSIYSYDLSNLKPSIKVRFVYVLKGRGSEKGIVLEKKGEFLANSCFMVDVKHDKEIQEIFELWNVKYKKLKVQLMD